MFKKTISKLISPKKTSILLLSILVFGGLFFCARPVRAVFGLLDLGAMHLDALDFVDNVIFRFIIFIALLIIESLIFVKMAAALLQWAISLPVHLHNLLVISGFDFVIGLTNLFFILIFVGIALAFILRTETFGMKKALPNLIIIALLINFSLVFVGMIVDIGDIFRNALLTSFGTNFVSLAIGTLESSGQSVAAWGIAIPFSYLLSVWWPYINAASLAAIGTLFLTDIATGGIWSTGFFLMILNFITGSIFFLYSGLFLVRIAIIWMLAIFAPLALFAYILPTTKKYFSQWLHYLLSWALMGIAAVFLIGMGLKLFAIVGDNALLPWGGDIDTGWGVLPGFIYNYLFLIIYLAVAFFACKKFVPMGADVIMNQGGAFVGKTWGALKRTRTMGEAAGEIASNLGTAAKWGEGLEGKGKLFKPLGWTIKRAAEAPIPALINYAAGVRKTPLPKNWKQMIIDDKVASINASRRDEDKLVQMHAMAEEGILPKAPQLGSLADRLQDKFKNDPHFLKERSDIADILSDRITADIEINLAVGQKSQDKMRQDIEAKAKKLSQEIEMKPVIDEEAKRLVKVGLFKTENEAQDDAAKNVAARYIHFAGLKSGDMKNVDRSTIESAVAGRALRDMTPQHLQAIQNNFGTETINKVIDNTFRKMFIGKTEKESRDILDDYYAGIIRDSSGKIITEDRNLASKHARMVHWAATTPAGREWNLPLRKYMSDPNDQATTNIDAYEKKQKIREILSSLSKAEKSLETFYSLHIDEKKYKNQIEDVRERIDGLILRGRPTAYWEKKLESTEQQLKSIAYRILKMKELEINPDSNLRRKWEEIENLRTRGK